ncbi:MAG: hypothetical protein R2741_04310 [Methanolobus sp.]
MECPEIDPYFREAELIEKMYMDLLDGTTQRRMKRVDDGSTGLQNVEYRICVINSKMNRCRPRFWKGMVNGLKAVRD